MWNFGLPNDRFRGWCSSWDAQTTQTSTTTCSETFHLKLRKCKIFFFDHAIVFPTLSSLYIWGRDTWNKLKRRTRNVTGVGCFVGLGWFCLFESDCILYPHVFVDVRSVLWGFRRQVQQFKSKLMLPQSDWIESIDRIYIQIRIFPKKRDINSCNVK